MFKKKSGKNKHMKTIEDYIVYHAQTSPNKAAIIADKEVVTYATLLSRIQSSIAYFQSLGLQQTDRIIVAASSEPEFAYGYFAAHFLGIIAVPVDPNMSAERLEYILKVTESAYIFGFTPNYLAGKTCYSLKEFVMHTPCELPHSHIETDQIADLLFTSGTTGQPKGVMLSHNSIKAAADNINRFIHNTGKDIEVMPLPLSHSFGLGRLRCNMMAGGTIVLVSGFTNPSSIFRAIEEYKATGLAMVPAGFAVLLQISGSKLSIYKDQLSYIEIGSSIMPPEHKQKIMELLPSTRICMHYGLTEASRSVFIEFHRDKRHLTSVGKSTPGVSIKVVDQNYGGCAANVTGRILVKGEHIMRGYWNDSVKSITAVQGNWLNTGDFGYIDNDGYLHLQARESDLINVGGRKVMPTEIEELLSEHEAVSECVCIGIPDPRGISGSAVKAFMVLSKSCEIPPKNSSLASFLRGKIETYKMPVAYQWISKIPRTESGKIQRSAVLTSAEQL